MVTCDDVLKIIDFGVSDDLSNQKLSRERFKGTPAYMPPECFSGKTYNWFILEETSFNEKACDIWGLGCILYFFVTGKHLFNSIKKELLIEEINTE